MKTAIDNFCSLMSNDLPKLKRVRVRRKLTEEEKAAKKAAKLEYQEELRNNPFPPNQPAGGILRTFVLRHCLGAPVTSQEEEDKRKAEEDERWRQGKRASVTLTVGTVELIDKIVLQTRKAGFVCHASRDKIVRAALDALIASASE